MMTYTQLTTDCFSETIGAQGADKAEFDAALNNAKAAVTKLSGHWKDKSWPVLTIAEREDDLAQIEETAQRIKDNFETVVVMGMGASSCGGSTLVALAANRYTGATADGMKLHFIDNIDPFSFDQLIASLDFKTTMFLFISKSGGTAETLAQLLVLLHEVENRLGRAAIKSNFTLITEPGENAMRRIANEHGIYVLDHDPDIGGRFAALTAVGMLPAKVAGLDIRAIRRGAADVIKHTFLDAAPEPAIGAALHHALLKKGKTVAVMMPYCDRLHCFSAWHQQLWEESLGKEGHGTTALRALGALDQHSQLQLYLDGPHDKFVTFILLEQEGKGAAIPASADKSLSYLNNHTIGDLIEAEQNATWQTLTRNKRPSRVLKLKTIDEKSIGALMMHFMLETMITAQLWNIDPFGQPSVEESKVLTREFLSK